MIQPDPMLTAYFRDVGRHPLITITEERNLIKRIKNDHNDIKAQQQLVEANLQFVIKIAKHYRRSAMPMSDLIGLGNLGLIEAIESFDTAHKTRFCTYAAWWIRRRILNAIHKDRRNRLDARDQTSTPQITPYESVEQMDNLRRAMALVDALPARERKIINMRFGLNGGKVHTLKATAAEVGVCRERVRQLQKKVIEDIHTKMNSDNPFTATGRHARARSKSNGRLS